MGNDGPAQGRQVALTLVRQAGEMLAAAAGPRIAVLEMGGWDTHANEMNPNGALANNLRTLDAALGALRESLGSAWRHSVVLVATEFGREVAVNGTMGSDHGSGGAAFVLGGAVAGGRVITDWPGLSGAADGADAVAMDQGVQPPCGRLAIVQPRQRIGAQALSSARPWARQ